MGYKFAVQLGAFIAISTHAAAGHRATGTTP